MAHPFSSPKYLKNITLPNIDEGLQSSNRTRTEFDLSIAIMTGIGANEESHKKAVRACRDQVAFYASTPNYKAVLEQHGYEDLSEELNRLSKAGQWKKMGDAIDDEVLNTFAVISEDPDELAKEIMRRYGNQGQRIAPILYSGELELMPPVLEALKNNSL